MADNFENPEGNATDLNQGRTRPNVREIVEEDPLALHSSDHPGMNLVTAALTGRNYLAWSRSVRIALGAKLKLGFIDGTIEAPEKSYVNYEKWRRANYMVTSWLLNSISKEIVDAFLYTETAQELWNEIEERFGGCNGPQLYQIQRQIASIAQGSMSISQYYTKLKKLWDELTFLMPVPSCTCGSCTCGASKAITSMTNFLRLIQFLMGLNEEYEAIKSQILVMEPLPPINKAYSMFLRVERQKEVQINFAENSEVNAMMMGSWNSTKNDPGKGPMKGYGMTKREKEQLFCDHCKIRGHSIEGCFKIIGYPDWFKGLKERKKMGVKNMGNSGKFAANIADTPFDLNGNDSGQNQTEKLTELMCEMMKLIKEKNGNPSTVNYANIHDYTDKTEASPLCVHVPLVALLNCYVLAKCVDKTEATMQKVRDMGYATRPIWYNIMMKLYYQLENWEKLDGLMNEMEEKGFPLDRHAFCIRLCACVATSNPAGIDKIVSIMQSDSCIVMDWKTYALVAQGYLRVGFVEKALEMVHKLESLMDETKRKDPVVMSILNLYAEMGKKDQLYRIWNEYKQENKVINKVYMVVIRALMKFNDVEGVEKVFEEWESSGLSYDFRIPNFLINAYCRDGLLEKAEALLQRGISKGGKHNVVTWCHLAGGYIMKNHVSEAVEALKKAISTDPLYPNRDTLITCVEYLERKEDMGKFTGSLCVKGIPSAAVVDKLYSFIKEDEGLSFCAKQQI